VTDTPPGPWDAEVAASKMTDLNTLWQKWNSPEFIAKGITYYKDAHGIDVVQAEVSGWLANALGDRKHWLENNNTQPGPDPRRTLSTAERIDDAIVQHLAATDAYAVAVEESARQDAESKRVAARKYLEVKASIPEGQKRVTDTEANRAVDADQNVLEARLASDIAAAQAKAARSRLDHWDHVINWGRSVYSRESKADTR
jgi:hypothetical protein